MKPKSKLSGPKVGRIEIEFAGGISGKPRAPALDPGIEFNVGDDLEARLEVGGQGWAAVALGNPAEVIIAHDGTAERDVPRADRGGGRRWRRLDGHVGGGREAGGQQECCSYGKSQCLHRLPPKST